MKRLILPLAAAFCTSFAASALDATDARLWLDDKDKLKVTDKTWNDAKSVSRTTWQYVSIPVQVEGVAKGEDSAPHFIPEMQVHVYALFSVNDREKEYVLLDKELNYVEIPLDSKHADKNKGSGTVNVGVFISPGNAYKLAPKDGDLRKKLVAVAVEATFKGAPCIRKDSGNRAIVQYMVFDNGLAQSLKSNWWRSKSSFKNSCGAVLHSIAETPYAAQYNQLDMPALSPMYAGGPAGSSASSSSSSYTGGPTSADTADTDISGTISSPDSDSTDSSATTEEDDSSTKGSKKNNKKNKGKKRSRD